jgi:hypothetical protein
MALHIGSLFIHLSLGEHWSKQIHSRSSQYRLSALWLELWTLVCLFPIPLCQTKAQETYQKITLKSFTKRICYSSNGHPKKIKHASYYCSFGLLDIHYHFVIFVVLYSYYLFHNPRLMDK